MNYRGQRRERTSQCGVITLGHEMVTKAGISAQTCCNADPVYACVPHTSSMQSVEFTGNQADRPRWRENVPFWAFT